MKLIALFNILVLFLMKNLKWNVQASMNLNPTELEYLSKKLDPIECMKLLEALYRKSFSNNIQHNLNHNKIIGTNMIDCRLKLEKWNRKFPMDNNKDAHKIMLEMLLKFGRADLANYIERGKRSIDVLSSFTRSQDVQIDEEDVPLTYGVENSNFLLKLKDENDIKMEPETDEVTSGIFELNSTPEYYGIIATTQSIIHSEITNGMDNKISQLLIERSKELASKNTNSNKSGEMSSSRWIGFIIILLFIFLAMFMTAVITIYKNRGNDGCNRGGIVKKECSDSCPLINYSSVSPDIEQRWSSSSMDLCVSKPCVKSSVSSLQWPTINHSREESIKMKTPKTSEIIINNEDEKMYKIIKNPKLKSKRNKVIRKMKRKKSGKCDNESKKILDEIKIKERIINCLCNDKPEFKYCNCSRGNDVEIGVVRNHYTEPDVYNSTELHSDAQALSTEIEETPRKEETLKKMIEQRQNSSNKTTKLKTRSPRLSFPMACTNKNCNMERQAISCRDNGQRKIF